MIVEEKMKKILVPVDGSPASEKAAKEAVEIAKQFASKILFITVLEKPVPIWRASSVQMNYSEIEENLKKHKSEMLNNIVAESNCSCVFYDKRVVLGEPAEEILNYAGDGDFDMIVMGRRGFSKLKRFFAGSVTEKVLAEAKCPVLIINDDED
jgi:nucleotide-binding universal stress UspA family protein